MKSTRKGGTTSPTPGLDGSASAALQQIEHSGSPDIPGTGSRAGKKRTEKEPNKIELPKLNIGTIKVTLVGDSPLISHKWSEKAKKAMLDKQMKRAKGGKQAKNPWQDFLDSMYWLSKQPDEVEEGADLSEYIFGFPSVAFKAAAVDACSHVDGVTKVEARGAFHINGEMVTITGTPTIREDMVRVGMGTADLRYRGEFKQWKCEFVLRYNKNVLSVDQIVNLFNTAGFAIGVGEWRPQKDGAFGMFHVATEEETTDDAR